MKRINIQLLLTAALMVNMASTQGMNRFTQSVRAAIGQKNGIVRQDSPKASWAFLLLTGKGTTQRLLDGMRRNTKNGIIPTTAEINKLMDYSQYNNYGILNQPDDEGHTLLNDVIQHKDYSPKHRYIIKALRARGAQLSNRDKYVMGPESLLKTYLGLPPKASASTTIKVLRTFNTKNSSEKLGFKLLTNQMTEQQVNERTQKRLDINTVYNTIKPDLDARCMQERQIKRSKQLIE
jgi:hypothetical protein